ncbi:extensin family protein [Qipengyuania aquimaris]|nr:extensin family protein [Qipengyuania aquimaris]
MIPAMRFKPLILALPLMLAACVGQPADRAATAPRPADNTTVTATLEKPETRQCLADLGATGATFSPLPDRYYGAGCKTVNSVQLSRVGGDMGQLQVTNLKSVACPLANTFASWARFGVDRAARQVLGSPLARIETMGSYSCRNVAGTGRLSAHSRAEAVDVGAFVLADGRRISVKNGWNASKEEREFLRVIHRSACKRFGTVLGPDYNAAHHDHLHLELGIGSFCR